MGAPRPIKKPSWAGTIKLGFSFCLPGLGGAFSLGGFHKKRLLFILSVAFLSLGHILGMLCLPGEIFFPQQKKGGISSNFSFHPDKKICLLGPGH